MKCDCSHEAEEYFTIDGKTLCSTCQEAVEKADQTSRELGLVGDIEIYNKGDAA